jgi:hypothetical protein
MIARQPSVLAAYILAALIDSMFLHPAWAAATFQVAVNASASALDGNSDNDFPPESDTGVIPIGPLPFDVTNGLSAGASVGAASGNGLGMGEARLTLPGTFEGAILGAVATMEGIGGGPTNASATGLGRSRVIYEDVLTAGGLPIGTPVTLRVTLELDGAMQLVVGAASNYVQLTFFDPGTTADPIDQLICANLTGPCSDADTGELIVNAGVPHTIRLELFTQVAGTAFSEYPFASASSDFNTSLYTAARLHIDVLTPGASYTLDSGGDLRSTPDGAGRVPDGSTGVPLRLDKVGGMTTLSWGVSCQAADTDYAVYEGMLGNFASHDSRFCTTGGATTITFTPIANDAYYLVVPLNATHEGSYGKHSLGAERPQGLHACLPQSIAVCP